MVNLPVSAVRSHCPDNRVSRCWLYSTNFADNWNPHCGGSVSFRFGQPSVTARETSERNRCDKTQASGETVGNSLYPSWIPSFTFFFFDTRSRSNLDRREAEMKLSFLRGLDKLLRNKVFFRELSPRWRMKVTDFFFYTMFSISKRKTIFFFF